MFLFLIAKMFLFLHCQYFLASHCKIVSLLHCNLFADKLRQPSHCRLKLLKIKHLYCKKNLFIASFLDNCTIKSGVELFIAAAAKMSGLIYVFSKFCKFRTNFLVIKFWQKNCSCTIMKVGNPTLLPV